MASPQTIEALDALLAQDMAGFFDDPLGTFKGKKTLGREDIAKGLNSMAKADPAHFADMIGQSGDAITADVFFQHVVFGKVIYG